MKLIIPGLLFSILLTFSCRNNQEATKQKHGITVLPITVDTSDYYYQDLKAWKKWLNISETLKKDSDIDFRLWYSPELLTKKQLLHFQKSAGKWHCTQYFIDIRNQKLDSSKKLIPKNNWENIEIRFAELNIGQLPNDRNVPANLLYEDGISFIAEISDSKSYRFSKFSNPKPISKQNEDAKSWSTLLEFMSQEFDILY